MYATHIACVLRMWHDEITARTARMCFFSLGCVFESSVGVAFEKHYRIRLGAGEKNQNDIDNVSVCVVRLIGVRFCSAVS